MLDRINWSIDACSVIGLVGASGAGKTTLLRILAGLSEATEGNVSWHAAGDRPPRIGMVFQNLALWPHLTARRHLECVLGNLPRRERRARAEHYLSQAHLPARSWDLKPTQLSGGEAQRLAIARALAPEPDLLFLDEPLAHVDAPLRGELLELVRSVLAPGSLTSVYVTHSWGEAAALCRRIAVIDRGSIVQEDIPEEVFWRPANLAVARQSGPVLELPLAWIQSGLIACSAIDRIRRIATDASSDCLFVRPQQLRVHPTAGSPWQVVECRPHESVWHLTLARDGLRFGLLVGTAAVVGSTVKLELAPADCFLPSAASA